MEAEALESILVDDFKVISTSPYHFAISLAPHPAGDGIENHGVVAYLCILLTLSCIDFLPKKA